MNKKYLLKKIKRKTPISKNLQAHLFISDKTTASKASFLPRSGSKRSKQSNLQSEDNISRQLFSSIKKSGKRPLIAPFGPFRLGGGVAPFLCSFNLGRFDYTFSTNSFIKMCSNKTRISRKSKTPDAKFESPQRILTVPSSQSSRSPILVGQSDEKRASDYKEGFEFLIRNKHSIDSFQRDIQHLLPHELSNGKLKHLFSPNSGSKARPKRIKIMRFTTDKRRSICDARELNSEPVDSAKRIPNQVPGQRRISKFCADQSSADKRVAKERPVVGAKGRKGNSNEGAGQKRTRKARKSAKILTKNLNHLRRITQISLQNQSHQSKQSRPGLAPCVRPDPTEPPFVHQNMTLAPTSPKILDKSNRRQMKCQFEWKPSRSKLGKFSLKSPKIMTNLVLESFLKTPHSFLEQESPKNHLQPSSNGKLARHLKAESGAGQSGSKGLELDRDETANMQKESFQPFQKCHYLLQKRQTRNRQSKSSFKSVQQNLNVNVNRTRGALPPLPITPSNLMKRGKKLRNGPKTILNFNINSSLKSKITNFDCNIDFNLKTNASPDSRSKDVFAQATETGLTRLMALNDNLPKIGSGMKKEPSESKGKSQAPRKKSKSEKAELGKFPLIRVRKNVQSRESEPKKGIRRFLAKLGSNKSLNGPSLGHRHSTKAEKRPGLGRESLSRFRKFQSKSNLPNKNVDKTRKIISKIKDSREIRVMMKAWNLHSSRKTPKTRNLYKKIFRAVMTENAEEHSRIDHLRGKPRAVCTKQGPIGDSQNLTRDKERPRQRAKDEPKGLEPGRQKQFDLEIPRVARTSWGPESVLTLECCISLGIGGRGEQKRSVVDHYFHRDVEQVFFGQKMPNLATERDDEHFGAHRRVDFDSLQPFLAASHEVEIDGFDSLLLFELQPNCCKVRFGKLLDFYGGNFDVFQIKRIVTQVIEICIFLENRGIGICAVDHLQRRKTRRGSFDGESLCEDLKVKALKSERSHYKCKTERDETPRELPPLGTENGQIRHERSNAVKKGRFNLIDHLILEGNRVRIAVNGVSKRMFSKDASSADGKRGLRILLGLFIFNFIFNRRKTLADVDAIVSLLERISAQKSNSNPKRNRFGKRSNKNVISMLCDDAEEELEYRMIAHKVSIGFINILKKLLMTSEIMNLENLREFFERQEIGVKNMGNFSLSISDLTGGFIHGKCVELFAKNDLSDLQNFKRILMCKIG